MNENLTKCIKFYFFNILMCLIFISYAQATPPGKSIKKLKEKELTATLFVISVASEASNLKGVEFLWLPAAIKAQCLNQTPKACLEISRDRKQGMFKKYPTRTLTSWVSAGDQQVYPESIQILEDLAQIEMIKKLMASTEGEHHFELIDGKRTLKARIYWELWPNGENFRVLKIVGK